MSRVVEQVFRVPLHSQRKRWRDPFDRLHHPARIPRGDPQPRAQTVHRLTVQRIDPHRRGARDPGEAGVRQDGHGLARQDRAVAAQAMQTMLQAQSELAAGEGEREPTPGSESARDEPAQGQSGIARQADETYRSVSAMWSAEGVFGEPTSLFA